MAAEVKLSPTMQEALKTISKWGGEVHRWPGGFWCGQKWVHGAEQPDWEVNPYFSTQTIRALVARELLIRVDDPQEVKQFLVRASLAKNETTLDLLIADYRASIWADKKLDDQKVAALALAVEAEAERIGYTNHEKLRRLHTQAETAVNLAEGAKMDWEMGDPI